MASNTPNLDLLKKDPVTDANDTFNIETMLNENWDKVDEAVGNKVDKVAGKQLSTEDYTTTEKTKLAGIAANANNYVHPTTAGNKHIPTGGATGNFLKYSADGTAVWATPTKTDVGLGNVTNKDLSNVDNVKQLPATYGNIVSISASVTLGAAHADRVLDCTNSAAITITVPTSLDIGTQITVIRRGAGTVTFAPASGVTLNSKDTKRAIAGQHASATLVKVASTIWQLIGALE